VKMAARSWRCWEMAALVLLILLAAFLRFYHLHDIPVGLDADEAEKGWEARRVVSGEQYPIFFTAGYGAEPMHYYATALSLRVFGIRAFSVRFGSAVAGLLLVPVIYLLARELFVPPGKPPSLVPILSAFWVATSYWHLTYSRIGMEPVYLPLFASATAYLLWRGIRTQKRTHYLLAGCFLGASLYTARPVRFFPILLLVFLAYHVLTNARFRQVHLTSLLLLGMVFLLVLLPLATYALVHPDMFFKREMAVTILNPELQDQPLPPTIFEGIAKTFGMYNLVPDPQFERNPAHRPILDALSSAFFLVGLTSAWLRRKQPAYAFVFLWLMVMSLPGALTPDVAPHYSRGIGALPAVALLFSVGVDSSTRWLQRRRLWPTLRRAYWPLLCLALITMTSLSCRDYFFPWLERQRQGLIMHAREIDAAGVMNSTSTPNGVWILPASSVDAARLPFFAVSFLYEGVLPHHTLHVDEASCAKDLAEICRGHSTALVVNWTDFITEKAYQSQNSDPKGLIDFLLRKYGRRLDVEPFQSFDLVTYELPESPNFSIARSFQAFDVNFGDELSLVGVAFGGSSLSPTSTLQEVERKVLPSGKEGWVVLQWQSIKAPSKNYKVAVYLLDGQGRLVGQADKLLLSNYLQPTSGWTAVKIEMDYYTLPSLPATPPGEYTVEVAVYDAHTLERLTVFDAETGAYTTSIAIGELEVIKPLTPAEVQPLEKLPSSQVSIAPGLQLLGYDMPLRAASPGETVRLALYWRAAEDLARDYLLSLQLKDEQQETRLEQKARPVDGTYPTTEWDAGEVLRDWHDLQLPPDTPSGRYELLLQVLEEGETIGQASLGSLEVSGRLHQFDIPSIQHPLEARLGDTISLLGYDLGQESVTRGDRLQLTLYWQALEEMQVSYTVFTHLIGAQEQVWGQMDSIPLRGGAPTTSWVTGEIISDQYDIVVDPEAPPGNYVIEIGMYDPSSGRRLPVLANGQREEGDRLLLAEVKILP